MDYISQFPLNKFIKWYMDWAMNLLRRVNTDTEYRKITEKIQKKNTDNIPNEIGEKRSRSCPSNDKNKRSRQVTPEEDDANNDSDDDSDGSFYEAIERKSTCKGSERTRLTYGRSSSIPLTSLTLSCLPSLSLNDKVTSLLKNGAPNDHQRVLMVPKLVTPDHPMLIKGLHLSELKKEVRKSLQLSSGSFRNHNNCISNSTSNDIIEVESSITRSTSVSNDEKYDDDLTYYRSYSSSHSPHPTSHLYISTEHYLKNKNENKIVPDATDFIGSFAKKVWNLLSLNISSKIDHIDIENDNRDEINHSEEDSDNNSKSM